MTEEKKEVRRIVPPVDIYETSNDVVLVADVPGLTKEKLELDIEKDELTIKGAFEEPDGKADEYEISPGVAVFIPKDCVHWFRNLDPNEEVEICGVYSAPDAGDYKPEDYKYVGEITERDKKLR